MLKFTKKRIYIGLFAILYAVVAFSSFYHACAFFGLANNDWMSIILALAFEIGQAAVLFSLLTSKKDRSRIMPWVLMTIFTLVQVIGNVFSSYKYIITNSVENLRFFKEPIFIWTDIPDDQATVIIVYLVGAILPIAALLLTSMITNYLTDQEELTQITPNVKISETIIPQIDKGPDESIKELNNKKDFIETYNNEPKILGTDPDGGVKGEEGEDGTKFITTPVNEIIPVQPMEEPTLLINELKENEQQNETSDSKSNNEDKKQLLDDTNTEQTNQEESGATNIENGTEEIKYDPDAAERAKVETMVDKETIDKNLKKPSHFINL